MVLCPTPGTGNGFLSGTLSFIDCHARSFGEAGYLALSSPGSVPFILLTLAVTIVIALFGIRLMLGTDLHMPEIMMGLAKIAVVMLLVLSWPAVRTLIYDTTMSGPDEIATSLGAETIGVNGAANSRLQRIDDGLVALTQLGTGRKNLSVGSVSDGSPAAEAFQGAAMSDDSGFAIGRYAFLATTIGATALIKFGAGVLIALTPLFALLLLFGATQSLFTGWLRALLASAVGAIILTMMLQAEAMLIEPWLTQALAVRAANYATPSSPIELAVITTSFAIATFGLLALVARLCFFASAPHWMTTRYRDLIAQSRSQFKQFRHMDRRNEDGEWREPSRAYLIADAVATEQRRERLVAEAAIQNRDSNTQNTPDSGSPTGSAYTGTSMPRHSRVSALGMKRDALR